MPKLGLTRNLGQSLHIGPDVIVTVSAVHGKAVTLTIEAPAETLVLRAELVRRSPKGGN